MTIQNVESTNGTLIFWNIPAAPARSICAWVSVADFRAGRAGARIEYSAALLFLHAGLLSKVLLITCNDATSLKGQQSARASSVSFWWVEKLEGRKRTGPPLFFYLARSCVCVLLDWAFYGLWPAKS
jgi:hypothetical protein